MFRNIKHRLGKKGKRAAALLAAVILLCACTGCDKNETGSAAPNRITSALPSTPAEESEDLQSSEADSSDPQNGQSSGQSDFDFDEAVKSITLFDNNISLPCTIKAFGDDFSLDNAVPAIGIENQMFCQLMYKEKMIGNVFLQDCKENDNFEEKQIVAMSLGDTNGSYPFAEHTKAYMEKLGKYTDLIQLDFGGISMASNEEQVRMVFGDSPHVIELHGKDRYWLDYDFECGGITVTIGNDKINEIHISLK